MEEGKEKQDRYTIQTVEKALDVIEILSKHDSLSLIELVELMNQPKSTLYRVILTLEKRGFITRSEDDGKYCLGFKQLEITKNMLARSSLRTAALSEMQVLSEEFGDTVNLCTLDNDHVLYVDIIEGTHALRMTDAVGSKVPFHATAAGKAMVAYLPEDKRSKLLDQTIRQAFTSYTICQKSELEQELMNIQEAGYAVDREEIVEGARCVAAPIFNMFGQVKGAISVSGAKHRFLDADLPDIATHVKAAAHRISQKLGFSSSD